MTRSSANYYPDDSAPPPVLCGEMTYPGASNSAQPPEFCDNDAEPDSAYCIKHQRPEE